jgi:hypothetical protein
MLMTIYCAENCDTAIERQVERLDGAAGRIVCLECGGEGNWGKFAPEIVGPDYPCPVCKGAGLQLVSI